MRNVFDFYADPGHGWAKVDLKTLAKLGLSPADFSSFSYLKGDNIYLEEDADLTAFVNRHGNVRFREHHTDNESRIRSYWPNTDQGRAYQAEGLI